jgi:hypothetical protein
VIGSHSGRTDTGRRGHHLRRGQHLAHERVVAKVQQVHDRTAMDRVHHFANVVAGRARAPFVSIAMDFFVVPTATPAGRAAASKPSSTANVVALPRAGGLHHRYEWRAAA